MTREQISTILKFLNRATPKGQEEERELLWIISSLVRAGSSQSR
jgi:hypothetical protein